MNKLPTIDIKGKPYTMVKDRIIAFNELYKDGCIQTEIISPIESKTIIVKAIVIPDIKNPERRFIDYSQAVIGQGLINTSSALENASTSAVGRALAYMGIGVIESVASADEVIKATTQKPTMEDRATAQSEHFCKLHNKELKMRQERDGVLWDHRLEIDGVWNKCFGNGWKAQKPFIKEEIPERDVNEEV
jgi:hypothetical protein